jgi:hypothetical protein
MQDSQADKDLRAGETLKALIQGLDPRSGEALPAESVLQRAEVLRALLAAVAALEHSAARAQRRSLLPANVGRTWTDEEESKLVTAFKSGEAPEAIARRHRRTLRAIEARLERLGLLRADQRVTRGGFPGVSDALGVGSARALTGRHRAILAGKKPQSRHRQAVPR